jgi:WD40 repeat protein
VVKGLHAHDIDYEGGEIGLWRPSQDDRSLREFVGHEGHVVSVSVYVPPPSVRTAAAAKQQQQKQQPSSRYNEDSATATVTGIDGSVGEMSNLGMGVDSLSLGGDGGSSLGAYAFGEGGGGGGADQSQSQSQAALGQMRASIEHKDSGGGGFFSQEDKEGKHSRERLFRASKEEEVFFSVGDDGTIRAWDEFDSRESYQFHERNMSDVCCMHTLWNMNIIATGHENGSIRLWNGDAGTWVTSPKVLKEPLTCLVEASSARAHLLCGGDYSGKIAVWNLTSFQLNQSSLPVETTLQGPHDKEEPAVLSITYHAPTQTFLTGGNDRTVRLWKFGTENTSSLAAHRDAVCCLESSEHFLLSGDAAGEIVLWRILPAPAAAAAGGSGGGDTANKALPTVVPTVRWWNRHLDHPVPAVVRLHESDKHRVFVVQAGNGAERLAVVWKVWLQKRRVEIDTRAAAVSVTDLSRLQEMMHNSRPGKYYLLLYCFIDLHSFLLCLFVCAVSVSLSRSIYCSMLAFSDTT